MTKTETKTSWTISNKKHNVIYQLEHGSVFVLLPDDNKPSEFRTDYPILHKTKHKVDFNNDGISFAFVFRRVRKTSKFDPVTNNWLWQHEIDNVKNQVERFLDTNELKQNNFFRSDHEMDQLSSNIDSIIASLDL